MNNSVQWRGGRPVPRGNIMSVGNSLGVVFPPEYVAIIEKCEGGAPTPGTYDGAMFGYLLNMSVDDSDGIIPTMSAIRDMLPNNIIPFATDPGGNFWCFDYRGGANESPAVAYLTLDQSPDYPLDHFATRIEGSFSEFINALSYE